MRRRLAVAVALLSMPVACGSGSTSNVAPPVCVPLHVTAHRTTLAETDLQTPGLKLDLGTQPVGLALDRDGSSVWVLGTGLNTVLHVGSDGTATVYNLPVSDLGLNLSVAQDGTAWVPEQFRDAIGAIAPDGSARECRLPRKASEPASTAVAADGTVWVTETHGNAIAKFAGGRFTEYPIGVAGAEVLPAQDGGAWFTVDGAPVLGRITAAGDEQKTPIGGSGTALGLLTTSDGAVWVADFGGDRVVRVAPGGTLTVWKTANGAKPQSLAVGPGGTVWLTESGSNRLAAVHGSQVVEMLTTGAWPDHLVTTADGWAWFTEYYQDRLGRVRLPAV